MSTGTFQENETKIYDMDIKAKCVRIFCATENHIGISGWTFYGTRKN